VAGWDCRKYADAGLYDQKTLATDFAIVLVEARRVFELKTDLPVVFAGYSTGAEQVVAAAAFIRRPSRLDGLLLIAPGERGRYGLTTSDLMGVTPRGKGTFALGDFAAAMTGLRIVQIHGEHDPLDSTEWLALLKVPHELKVFPNGWHFFGGGPTEFLKMLDDAIDWIIAPAGNG
jgi:pimeloyl-ACP methyl ester carboxylesterase